MHEKHRDPWHNKLEHDIISFNLAQYFSCATLVILCIYCSLGLWSFRTVVCTCPPRRLIPISDIEVVYLIIINLVIMTLTSCAKTSVLFVLITPFSQSYSLTYPTDILQMYSENSHLLLDP